MTFSKSTEGRKRELPSITEPNNFKIKVTVLQTINSPAVTPTNQTKTLQEPLHAKVRKRNLIITGIHTSENIHINQTRHKAIINKQSPPYREP